MIPDEVRPLVSRLTAAVLPAILAHVGRWLGIEISQDFVSVLQDITAFMLVCVLTHRLIDRKANPGDAASPKMALVDKEVNQSLNAP